ncbi:hypothetical protein [Kutzneria buriramensis]|uniref:Uncharacterized protein n=1 Tax=Kutzneria buriramensis TaxID=1045776 RepID=A0A3E0GUF2_9PSEU|nr:hypothetical protein [Kutzneria buriramensis]REH25992.1 hypothetical protein BCF44_13531 [Kutzneria buriramensis]
MSPTLTCPLPLPLLAQMQLLASTRPGPDATGREVADWYDRKAALLARLADSADPEAASYAEQSVRAHQHALDLRLTEVSR